MNSSSTSPVSSDGPNPLAPPAPQTGVRVWERRPVHPEASLPRPYSPGELTQTPLYVQLVAEWRARGAMLPGARDLQWDRLASSRAFEEDTQRTLCMLRLERDPAPPVPGDEAEMGSGRRGRPVPPNAVGRLPRPR
ncbi:hypothetical protein OHA27_17935 [Streptomyces sp. NBC_01619]|uniref:hypothetical protein n=1 Tax=unclassified Streptomyces TaxID=2593676 RepID=UPI002255C7E6|nr:MULTISPECIES: hypothetical protein [unclassified Streptomyces]MCX4512149.1 hypothetical protein [Streptomyces sp. NBC_01619]